MAMSFSRPDPASPAAVADAAFSTSRRGFDQGEVRDFLRMVAAELGRLQERERFLERELREAQSNPDLSAVDMDDAALTRLLGEETARVLATAREAAAEIRSKAEQAGAQMLMEASDEAARVRQEAEVEAMRRRSDAAADAESELEMAKQQGREMVNEARAYRERVLSELARRRELAREQIEQLIHGRDRLAQAFERARLVAADVVAELEPLGEPDEYVNLAPTTGPVPVMVVNAPRESEAIADADPADVVEVGDDAQVGDAGDVADVADEDGATEAADEQEPAADEASLDEPLVDENPTADATSDDASSSDETIGEAPIVEAGTSDDAERDDAEHGDAEHDDAERDDAEHGDVERDDARADDAEQHDVGHDDADHGDARVGAEDRDEVVVDLFARLRADTARRPAEPAENTQPTSTATIVGDLHDGSSSASHAVDGDDEEHEVGEEGVGEDTPFRQRDAELIPLIVSSGKKLKRVLADEQNEVLDTLRRGDPVTGLDALLPAAAAHIARYVDAVRDDLLAAAHAGALAVTCGSVKKLRKAPAEAAVAVAGEVVGEWMVGPLRERLDRGIAEGDGDNAAASRRVRSVYREWKTQHIDERLDDVLRTAFGRGAYEAVEQGTPLVWSVDADHPACPDCDDNGLAGSVPAGEEFPTGDLFAPAHPGCRCLLLQPDS